MNTALTPRQAVAGAIWRVQRKRANPARSSLMAFNRAMSPGYIAGKHIDALVAALEAVERGELARLIVTMPPRHSKSFNVSEHFPAWFLGRNPDKRIIASSHTAQLSYTFSRRVRNKLAQAEWPFPEVRVAGDKGGVTAWDIARRKGGYLSVGVGGSPTGHGADLILIDDPIRSAADADSETVREGVWEWYQGTLRTRLQPGGAIILTATRWHEDDLTGRLLSEMEHGGEQWTHIHMPALDDEGSALWPEYWPVEALEKIRQSVGSRVWQAQYMGAPAPAEGGTFKRHWWRYWQPRGMALPPVPVRFPDGSVRPIAAVEQPAWWDKSAQSWDMTFKETKEGSYVVGLAGATHGPDLFIMPRMFRERTDFPGTVNAVVDLAQYYPDFLAKYIEEKANGAAVIDTLKRSVGGLIPVQVEGSKEARAHAVTPLVEAGNVYLPHPALAPWVEDFIAELAAFPNGAHDDQVDAFTQLARPLIGTSQTTGPLQDSPLLRSLQRQRGVR